MGLNQLRYDRATKVAEAVGSLLQQIDAETLREIVKRGEDEFVSHAKRYWVGHGFHATDLRQAFEMLRGRAITLPPDLAQKVM
jgi:hypothetical protein